MSKADDFMSKLRAQTNGGESFKKRQDKAIMRVFRRWILNRTDEYMAFTGDARSDAEYLGDHAKKACVDRDTAWESAEKTLKEWYDAPSVEDNMKDEFFDAYDQANAEEWWREQKFSDVM